MHWTRAASSPSSAAAPWAPASPRWRQAPATGCWSTTRVRKRSPRPSPASARPTTSWSKRAAWARPKRTSRASACARASLAELKDAALVVEAIVEDLDVKRTLFAELEGIVGPDCILATNTSSISVTAIAAQLKRPERLVGMHFFNPVPLMALVEVVAASPPTRRRRYRLRHRRSLGQEPGAREVDAGLHRQPRGASLLCRGAAPAAGTGGRCGHPGCRDARLRAASAWGLSS
jgi:hypothetical protein